MSFRPCPVVGGAYCAICKRIIIRDGSRWVHYDNVPYRHSARPEYLGVEENENPNRPASVVLTRFDKDGVSLDIADVKAIQINTENGETVITVRHLVPFEIKADKPQGSPQ